jgi:hypothetical protein
LFFKRFQKTVKFGKAVRVFISRTNGIASSIRVAKGITVNSKHGWRVSRSFDGLIVAFQNKGISVRGRWSTRSGFNINYTDKKGFSFSQKYEGVSYNFTNPKYSSITLFGVQRRGKDVEELARMIVIGLMIINWFKLLIRLFWYLSIIFLYFLRYFIETLLASVCFIVILIYSGVGLGLDVILYIITLAKQDLLDQKISKFKFFYRYGWIAILLSSLIVKLSI